MGGSWGLSWRTVEKLFPRWRAEQTASHRFMAGDIGILYPLGVYGFGQETGSSTNGQPSDAGVAQGRNNRAAGQSVTVYDVALKKDN